MAKLVLLSGGADHPEQSRDKIATDTLVSFPDPTTHARWGLGTRLLILARTYVRVRSAARARRLGGRGSIRPGVDPARGRSGPGEVELPAYFFEFLTRFSNWSIQRHRERVIKAQAIILARSAAVLTATSNRWSLRLRDRSAACVDGVCHDSSILRSRWHIKK